MSPKAKQVLSRDHLDLAREEVGEEPLGVAATLLLHAAEAANPIHWRRQQIVAESKLWSSRRRLGRMAEDSFERQWEDRLRKDHERVRQNECSRLKIERPVRSMYGVP